MEVDYCTMYIGHIVSGLLWFEKQCIGAYIMLGCLACSWGTFTNHHCKSKCGEIILLGG